MPRLPSLIASLALSLSLPLTSLACDSSQSLHKARQLVARINEATRGDLARTERLNQLLEQMPAAHSGVVSDPDRCSAYARRLRLIEQAIARLDA